MIIRIAIVLLSLLLIFFLIRKYIHQKDTSIKKIFATIAVLIYLIALHNYHMTQESKRVQKMLIAFKEGKTIICKDDSKDVNITKDDYNFESGTLVFINNKIPDIRYSVDDCRAEGK